MRQALEQLFGLRGLDRRLAVLGITFVVGSIALSGWFLAAGDIVTAGSLLLYVVVGLLLAAIGFSPAASGEPNRRV